jgi:hypothetical protein
MILRRSALVVSAALAAIFACSAPPSDSRFVAQTPDGASFPPVAQVLVQKCGTLDCHGTKYRNLKIYGNLGLRLSPIDHPTSKTPTTADEAQADFDSVVGLEPEIMSEVVRAGGANPEQLTFVRNARGQEDHKGGTVVQVGSDEDTCITSWLAGQHNVQACTNAINKINDTTP